MKDSVAIVGAGILGRVIALELIHEGWKVTIFDRDLMSGANSCSYAAAGMLSPVSELAEGHSLVYDLGTESLTLWPDVLGPLKENIFFRRDGSILIAHSSDQKEWKRLYETLSVLVDKTSDEMRVLNRAQLCELEPELDSRFLEAMYFPLEGQMDNRQVLLVLGQNIEKTATAMLLGEEVLQLSPFQVKTAHGHFSFDWVMDCRGLSAKNDLADLRGVRGEMFVVSAPDVHLTRPIRLMHPRHPVYVVPRPESKYLIGATCLETEDMGPITVRSSLELLSASFLVHGGFSEAKVLETIVQCRPAFLHNKPEIRYQPGLIHVNGLYRNGFLISPAVAREVSAFLKTGLVPSGRASLFKESC